jgi:hypothetical protein
VNVHPVSPLIETISHKRPSQHNSGIPGVPRSLPVVTSLELEDLVISLPVCRILTVTEESTSYMAQVGSIGFGSRPSTPPRRSRETDAWNSSDLRGQTWGGELIPPFTSSDDINLSPGSRRLGAHELPRSTSPFHTLQETRHRQATAAQAAALGHPHDSNAVEDASRALNDNIDRSRGRSLDMDELARQNALEIYHARQQSRGQPGLERQEPSRTLLANILGSLDDTVRNQPISRTRVHTLDPSFSLEPLQRANSTPPYSGPMPVSRDLPKSGLNPYPQSRTPQLQSSGHFTTSPRDDQILAGMRDLNLETRSDLSRKVSGKNYGNQSYQQGI